MIARLMFSLPWLASALMAHEIGTTRVSVTFEPGTYAIEIATDGASLTEKLEAAPGAGSAEERFRRRVKILFDETEVRPEIAWSASQVGPVTLRLTGEIPAGTRQFRFRYGWTFATYSLSVRNGSSGEPVTEWLEGGQVSKPFDMTSLSPSDRWGTARRYLVLGFTHILPYGLDHMLFVLGLYLLSGRARTVLLQVSAFTAAHSITLGLSIYGVVRVAPAVVEPLIALSIAYVAIENIFLAELKSWRVALVFAFGLLHGMGFAGALEEVGLPRSEFATALLTFNVGVEAGQLAVIGAAFLLVGWRWADRVWYRARVVVPASAMIACMAVYWTLERLP